MQTIEINETLVPSMSWWDVVDDLACFGLHVVLIGVLSTVMIGAMLVALNPATQFPDIPWAFCPASWRCCWPTGWCCF